MTNFYKDKVINCEDCNRKIIITNQFTITCECGADYNSFGQRLAPRENWGWETGESYLDILNIDE